MSDDSTPSDHRSGALKAGADSPGERKYLLIALTGSIGTGKSAVAERLARRGASVIDADILARQAVEPGTEALRSIVGHFGSHLLRNDGTLDRRRLGEIVFADPAERAWLERCLHPRIRELFRAALATEVARQQIPPRAGCRHLIVYVIPLLFESTAQRDEFDYVVVVTATRETSITRIMRRDGTSRELAERKVSAQLPIEEKVRRADLVVPNDGALTGLDDVVDRLFSDLEKLPPRSQNVPVS